MLHSYKVKIRKQGPFSGQMSQINVNPLIVFHAFDFHFWDVHRETMSKNKAAPNKKNNNLGTKCLTNNFRG